MSFTIQEVVSPKIEEAKAKHIANLEILSSYVKRVATFYFNPMKAPTSVPCMINELSLKCQNELDELRSWVQFDSSLASFIDFVEESIEVIADEFWDWADTEIITAKQAAVLYGKSQSTIYRWIKSGKLKAIKEKGRWQIVK